MTDGQRCWYYDGESPIKPDMNMLPLGTMWMSPFYRCLIMVREPTVREVEYRIAPQQYGRFHLPLPWMVYGVAFDNLNCNCTACAEKLFVYAADRKPLVGSERLYQLPLPDIDADGNGRLTIELDWPADTVAGQVWDIMDRFWGGSFGTERIAHITTAYDLERPKAMLQHAKTVTGYRKYSVSSLLSAWEDFTVKDAEEWEWLPSPVVQTVDALIEKLLALENLHAPALVSS